MQNQDLPSLELELKQLLVESLELEDIAPKDIDSAQPLFGEGLGLDSIDALELTIAISKKYHIKMDGDVSSYKHHFGSVKNLATFVASKLPAAGEAGPAAGA